MTRRITASDPTRTVRLTAAEVTADLSRRTLTGTVYRYNEVGSTSAGPLRVAASMPPPPIGLPITLEHDRGTVRAHVALVDNTGERLRIAARVVDGDLGDAALTEAIGRQRGAFSLDIEDAEVVDGVIVSGRWEAIGQVGQPAFNSARIDQIAASHSPGGTPVLTAEQRARLTELLAMTNRSTEQDTELQQLMNAAGYTPAGEPEAAAPAPASAATSPAPASPAAPPAAGTAPAAQHLEPVAVAAAAVPAVPAGVPVATTTSVSERGGAFQRFVREVTAGLTDRARTGSTQSITAALADITWSAHQGVVSAPAWSGELWSGLVYQPQFSDLFTSGDLTNWEGTGWRFTSKLEIADYAGDKAEIPTDNVTTEASSWEAARMAVGVDIDRKFFDFPNEGFVEALFQQVRESWAIKLDAKVRAYLLAKAVAAESVGTQTSLLKAAAYARRALLRRRVGAASWIYVNDDDLMSLFDLTNFDLPALLDVWGINPRDFRASQDIPAGTVVAGVRQAAEVKTLPGSPFRVEAQNLTKGGVDEAFFGYWAIEEHHESAIAKVTFDEDYVAP